MFGETIKALRFGFSLCHVDAETRYVRISPYGRHWLVEVCRVGCFPRKPARVKEHVCWWHDPGVIQESEFLTTAVREYRGDNVYSFLLDDDGRHVEA